MRNTLVPATQQILRIRVCQSEPQRLSDSARCRNRRQRPPTSHPAAVSGRFSADYACFSAAWTGCPGLSVLYNPCVAPRRPPPRPSWRPPSSTVRAYNWPRYWYSLRFYFPWTSGSFKSVTVLPATFKYSNLEVVLFI